MQEPLASYGHVGLVHHMAYPQVISGEGPILETLEAIALDPFFAAVEVTRMKDSGVRKQAAAMLSVAGMEVVFVAVPPLLQEKLSLCDLSAAKRKKAVDFARGMIDQAYELGASIMVVASGPDPGEAQRAAATGAFTESLKELCRDAQEKAGASMLSISVENFDQKVDKRFLLGPTKAAADLVSGVYAEYSNVGLTIDLSHQPLLGESIAEMVLNAVEHLIHVHIGNCVVGDKAHAGYGDKHPRFGCPGGAVGQEELKRFLESLVYAGYFKKSVPTTMPVVSFEVRPMADERPEWVIANAKRALTQAWARL